MRLRSRDSRGEDRRRVTERQAAVQAIETAVAEIDAEILNPSALRWLIGGPFLRLEQARVQAEAAARTLPTHDRARVKNVLDAYERLFEAVAAAQRERGAVGAKAPLRLTPELRCQLERARTLAQDIYEQLASDTW